MIILAIETSCDDTGVAVIKALKKSGFNILSNVVSSQIEVHKKWGGVYPALARREHQKNLVPSLIQALKEAKLLKESKIHHIKSQKLEEILKRENVLLKNLKTFLNKYQKPNIDLIAVTNGPGLEPCLWIGVNFAKALSYWWNIPIVSVNHIESHILVNWLKPINECQMSNVKCQMFPAIALIVSGGHTQLILMKEIGDYKIVGETRDDAAGECFDKTAKILGLKYPGGPIIAKLAKKYKSEISLPRPMINTKDYDLSFSGLKTAVLYNFKKQPVKIRKSRKYIQTMAYEIQQAIIDVLIKKTIKAAKDYKVKTIILGGGVTANKELRKRFRKKAKEINAKLYVPSSNLCTDNAVMTGITGFFKQPENLKKIEAKANLRIK